MANEFSTVRENELEVRRLGAERRERDRRSRLGILSPEEKQSATFEGLQQEQLAPGVSMLQRGLRELGAQRFGSTTEREAALRGATRGAGEALGSLQAAAARTAEGITSGRSQLSLQREALAIRERERGEDLASLRGRIDPSSDSLREASLRLATRPGFEGTALDRPSTAASIRFGATRQERAAIEQQGLDELRALSGGGIEQQLGGVF